MTWCFVLENYSDLICHCLESSYLHFPQIFHHLFLYLEKKNTNAVAGWCCTDKLTSGSSRVLS